MIRLDNKYPGRVTPADANYTYGSVKNETVPNSSNDGTPLDELWGNDWEGLKQAIALEAGITPNDTPDTVLDCQSLIGLKQLLKTGRKNKLFGNFFINQRGVSGSVVLGAGVYGHDRFKAGAGGCSYTFATSNGVTTITISAGTLEQVIEAANIEAGDYILSWQGTAQGQIDGGGFGDSGDVTDTLNGSADVTVEFDTGTLSLPQLELGTNVTAFERRSIGEEELLCQRYYYASDANLKLSVVKNVFAIRRLQTPRPIPMRVSPSEAATTNTGALTFSGTKNTINIGSSNAADATEQDATNYTADAEL